MAELVKGLTHWFVDPACVGSIPTFRPHNGGLAQLGEHLPYKQEVTGSSPVSSIFFYSKALEIFV